MIIQIIGRAVKLLLVCGEKFRHSIRLDIRRVRGQKRKRLCTLTRCAFRGGNTLRRAFRENAFRRGGGYRGGCTVWRAGAQREEQHRTGGCCKKAEKMLHP